MPAIFRQMGLNEDYKKIVYCQNLLNVQSTLNYFLLDNKKTDLNLSVRGARLLTYFVT